MLDHGTYKLLSYPGLKVFLSYRADSSFSCQTSYSSYHKTFPCFLRSCLFLVLSCQPSRNLQNTPEEHTWQCSAMVVLSSHQHESVYKYIRIYFLLEVSDSDCLLSCILHRYFACQPLKGQLTPFVRICVFLLGLWGCQWPKYNVLDSTLSQEASTEMPNSTKSALVLPARSPGCRELQKVVFATRLPLDWNSLSCSCRPHIEQCSCGAIVKGIVILAKYWLCLPAFLQFKLIRWAEYVCGERKDSEL